MKIAVLSGKGGAGKTMVSVNLAAVAGPCAYLDCDVEEPNGHLFFKPEGVQTGTVAVPIPVVDKNRCSNCRTCVEFCKFNALALAKGRVIVFPQVCHSCGGCTLLCPQKAIMETEKAVGCVQTGVSGEVLVHTGILNTGEASGMPIVKRLLRKTTGDGLSILDCPPGSACVVMECVKKADFCVLVAEPTLFGVHNLQMAYDLARLFGKPSAVVLNKCLDQDNPAEQFCMGNGIPILGRIPFDSEVGALNGNGMIVVNLIDRYRELFVRMLRSITGGGAA